MILTEWCIDVIYAGNDMNIVHFCEEAKDGLRLKWNQITYDDVTALRHTVAKRLGS